MGVDQWLAAEIIAVVLNIGFTICIAMEKRIGWLLGFVAACISVALYKHNAAWAMTGLNVFYAIMGLYGWWSWGRNKDGQRIQRRSLRFHLGIIAAGIGITAVLAWTLHRYVDGVYPHMDAFITVFSFAATWMMAHRLLENWIYWTVGDLVAVYFNHLLGLEWYALLNVFYIVLSVAGFWRWNRAYRAQQMPPPIA